jgi:hypothetical protein
MKKKRKKKRNKQLERNLVCIRPLKGKVSDLSLINNVVKPP